MSDPIFILVAVLALAGAIAILLIVLSLVQSIYSWIMEQLAIAVFRELIAEHGKLAFYKELLDMPRRVKVLEERQDILCKAWEEFENEKERKQKASKRS